MTITLEIGQELEAALARQAAAHGMGIDEYAASLLKEAAHHELKSSPPTQEVIKAIDRLKNFGKSYGISLGGLTIRELRHEGRP